MQTHPFLSFFAICRYKRVPICLERARTMDIDTFLVQSDTDASEEICASRLFTPFKFLLFFVLFVLALNRVGFLCIRIWERRYENVRSVHAVSVGNNGTHAYLSTKSFFFYRVRDFAFVKKFLKDFSSTLHAQCCTIVETFEI